MGLRFQSNYDSRLDGLRFSSSDGALSPQNAPEIVLTTLSIATAAMRNNQNLVVTTPAKESFGQVVAALLALDDQLDTMDEERVFADEDETDFKPGDKLKLGNAIVEYVRPDSGTRGIVIRYNPKNPLTHTLTYQQSLLLQRTDSQRGISTTRTFNRELKKLREETGLVGNLQREKTFSDSTVIIVGTLSRARASSPTP